MSVVVAILGISFGLTGESAKMSYGFMIFVELTMEFGNGRLNSVGAIKTYNQLLITKYDLSYDIMFEC